MPHGIEAISIAIVIAALMVYLIYREIVLRLNVWGDEAREEVQDIRARAVFGLWNTLTIVVGVAIDWPLLKAHEDGPAFIVFLIAAGIVVINHVRMELQEFRAEVEDEVRDTLARFRFAVKVIPAVAIVALVVYAITLLR